MTRAQPSPNAAPAPNPTPTPITPAGAGAATPSWPRFLVRHAQVFEDRTEVVFACAACTQPDFVDEQSGLCRPCWRVLVALAEVLRDMREGR